MIFVQVQLPGKDRNEIHIDFGEVYYNFMENGSNLLSTCEIEVVNNSTLLGLDVVPNNISSKAANIDFPVDIVALNLGIEDRINTYILPGGKKTVSFGMYSTSAFAQHTKSSFFHVVSSTILTCHFIIHDQNLDESTFAAVETQYVEIHCTATLCTSLFFMEMLHFQLNWNNANRYFETRDIQIWNRSECVLHYEIEQMEKDGGIIMQFVESSSTVPVMKHSTHTQQSNIFIVPPFASQQLALVVWPDEAINPVVEGTTFSFQLKNLKNLANQTLFTATVASFPESLIDIEDKAIVAINVEQAMADMKDTVTRTLNAGDSLDLSQQRIVGHTLKVRMDFGDCFIGLEKAKTIYLSNSSDCSIDVYLKSAPEFDSLHEVTVICTDNMNNVGFPTKRPPMHHLSSEASDSDVATRRRSHSAQLTPNLHDLNAKLKRSVTAPTTPLRTEKDLVATPITTANVVSETSKEFSYLNSFSWKSNAVLDASSSPRDGSLSHKPPGGGDSGPTISTKKWGSASSGESLGVLFARMWGSDPAMSCIFDGEPQSDSTTDSLAIPGRFGSMASLSSFATRSFLQRPDIVNSTEGLSAVQDKSNWISKAPKRATNDVGKVHMIANLSPKQQKLPITILLTPVYDDSVSSMSSGSLNPRSIQLELQINGVARDEVMTILSYDIRLGVQFRSCLPILAVSPLNIDFGDCQVGNVRQATISIANCSDLSTNVMLITDKSVIKLISEHVIPPRQSITVKVLFFCPKKYGAYSEKISVCCIQRANAEEVIPVCVKANIVAAATDFRLFRFITSDSSVQSQPQDINFEPCLFNTPNVRSFSIQNTHTDSLTLQFVKSASTNARIFLLSEQLIQSIILSTSKTKPFEIVTDKMRSFKHVDNSTLAYINAYPEVLFVDEKSEESGDSKRLDRQASRLKELEDLKWGENVDNVPANAKKELRAMKTEKQMLRTASFGINSSYAIELAMPIVPTSASNKTVFGSSTSDEFLSSLAKQNEPSTKASNTTARGLSNPRSITLSTNSLEDSASTFRDLQKVVDNQDGNDIGFAAVNDNLMSMHDNSSNLFFPFNLVNYSHEESDVTDSNKVEENVGKFDKAVDFASNNKGHSVDSKRSAISKEAKKRRGLQRNKSDLDNKIRRIQSTMLKFRQLDSSSSSLKPVIFSECENIDKDLPLALTESATFLKSEALFVDSGVSLVLVLVYDPLQLMGNASIGPTLLNEQCNSVDQTEELFLKVSPDAPNKMKMKLDGVTEKGPLNQAFYRTLSLKAKAVRSEFIAIQKNISFGRTLIGDVATQIVTVVNKSSITCFFSISKSGSISSSFLTVPQGRTGTIAPFSSRDIDFIFKPTLAGSFEEVLQINNILNPSNSQIITVKAKVSKIESFTLSSVPQLLMLHETPIPPNSDENSGSIEGDVLKQSHLDDMKRQELHCKGTLIKIFESVTDDSSPFAIQMMPQQNSVPSVLRTDNPKSDSTSLITAIPAAYLGSLSIGETCSTVLLFNIRNLTSKKRQFIIDASHENSVVLVNPKSSSIGFPFEFADVMLKSVVDVRCKFETTVVKSSKDEKGKDAGLDEEKRKVYQDNLEGFQQKLKIAIRKNKPEKIQKYQKKIDDVINILSGKVTARTKDVVSVDEGVPSPVAVDESKIIGESNKSTLHPFENKVVVNETNCSDVTFHFDLNPDEEKAVQVRITLYPGANYRHWQGALPVVGFLRVFECKNEDFVRNVPFGVLLSLPSSAIERQSNNPFIVTVAPWSGYPTKQIFRQNRQIPQDVLGMAVKLVQANQERPMYGSLSITSTSSDLNAVGSESTSDDDHVVICVGGSFSTNYSLDSIPFSESVHGSFSFAVLPANFSVSDNQQQEITEVHAPLPTNINFVDGFLKCRFRAKDKIDFGIQWKPSQDISLISKQEVRIVGTLKIEYFHHGESTGAIQYVPFVCILQHKSIIKVSKYCNFDQVPLRTYRMRPIPITNTSLTDDLHYVIISEEASVQSRLVGKIEITSGQTGVVRPNSCESITILLRTYSQAGKFEQKFWFRNVKDAFDQKRISFQATVYGGLPKEFVAFPDLTKSGTGSSYNQIELGLVQIHDRSTLVDSHLIKEYLKLEKIDTHGVFEDSKYPLRIHNISELTLYVTAKSNLKNQCFIYSDQENKQLAELVPILPDAILTLHVVLRPSTLRENNDAHGKHAHENESQDTHTELPSSENSSAVRDLVGGIRLMFYSIDSNVGVDAVNKAVSQLEIAQTTHYSKVYDTNLMYKAVIGKSILSISGVSTALNKVSVTDRSETTPCHTGVFKIVNQSSVFALRYCFLKPESSSVAVVYDESGSAEQMPTGSSGRTAHMIILDQALNTLQPGEERSVVYKIFCHNKSSSLLLHYIDMLNVDTGDKCRVVVEVFFDRKVIAIQEDNPEAPTRQLFQLFSPLTESHLEKEITELMESTSLITLAYAEQQLKSDLVEENSSSSAALKVFVPQFISTMDSTLFTFVLKNCDNKAVTLSPISNLPIQLSALHSDLPSPSRDTSGTSRKEGAAHLTTVRKGSINTSLAVAMRAQRSVSGDVQTEKPIGTFRDKLFFQCGESFTLEAHSKMTIRATAKTGVVIRDRILTEVLCRRKIKHGKVCDFIGIFAFLQASHALQTIFERPVSVRATSIRSTSPLQSVKSESPSTSLLSIFAPPSNAIETSNPAANSSKPTPTAPVKSVKDDVVSIESIASKQLPSLEVLPILSISEVKCSFILPVIRFKQSSININKFKSVILRGDRFVFELALVENASDVDVLFQIENIPSWMKVVAADDPATNTSNVFNVNKRATAVLKFFVRVPASSISGLNEVVLVLRNLSSLPSRIKEQSHHQTFNFRMRIDGKRPLEVTGDTVVDGRMHLAVLKDAISVPSLLLTQTQTRSFSIRNNTEESRSANISLSPNTPFISSIDTSLVVMTSTSDEAANNSHIALSSTSFNPVCTVLIQPMETISVSVTTTVGRSGRFDASAQGEEYRLPASFPLTEQATPTGLRPGLLGTISIALINHAINLSASENGTQVNSVVEEDFFLVKDDSDEYFDVLSVDVVGFFQVCPTCYLSSSTEGTLADSGDILFEVKGTGTSVGEKKHHNDFQKYSLPAIALSTESRTVYLHNPSSKPLNYQTESISCRHPGLRLRLINSLDEVFYDTVSCQLHPSRGVIAEGSCAALTVSLVPGNVMDSVNTTSQLYEDVVSSCPSKDSRHVLIVPVSIVDTEFKANHPSQTLYAVVVLKDSSISLQSLSAFHTQPVSTGNRNKQHLNRMLVRESSVAIPTSLNEPTSHADSSADNGDSMSPLDSELKLPAASIIRRVSSRDVSVVNVNNSNTSDKADDEVLSIRLRGATPIEGSNRYSVNLGQQTQKDEAVEWMLTLENCSSSVEIPFRLKCRAVSSPWLQLGQSGGVIPAGDSVSVMLYIVRAVNGSYDGWVDVENMADPAKSHAINVTMDVVVR